MAEKNMLSFSDLLKSDLKRNCWRSSGAGAGKSSLSKVLDLLFSKTMPAILLYRLRSMTANLPPGLPKIILSTLLSAVNLGVRAVYGIDIDQRAQIGKSLYIGHFGGIRIGRCRIGDYCALHHQVRIGPAAGGDAGNHAGPIIGDHVWIGAHVVIEGPVIIENHATIAPGSVVKRHVPTSSLVMGHPARVVARHYDNRFLLGR